MTIGSEQRTVTICANPAAVLSVTQVCIRSHESCTRPTACL